MNSKERDVDSHRIKIKGEMQMNKISSMDLSLIDIEHFCHKYHIKRLALFGSALRGELGSESDIDLLVEFDEKHIPSFFKLVNMEEELSDYFGGRKVDLRTPNDLSRYFRDEIMQAAEVLHVES